MKGWLLPAPPESHCEEQGTGGAGENTCTGDLKTNPPAEGCLARLESLGGNNKMHRA